MRSPQVSLALLLIGVGAVLSSAAYGNVLITIDKSAQRMTVAVDGTTRWTWPVSTGRAGYATPSGSFQAFRMEATHFSKEWDDAPMPHSIFFTKIGHAIHGTYEASHLGTAVSHGCVRLSTANAAKLYELVKQEGLTSTKVVISGKQPHGGEPEAYNSQPYQQDWFSQNPSGLGWGRNWSSQNSNTQNQSGQRFRGQQVNSDWNYRRDNAFPSFDPWN